MDSQNDILKSLADLEKNLLTIESASDLVKKSISQNDEIFKNLGNYTDILDRVNSNLSKVIDDTQKLQQKINSNINQSVDRLFTLTDSLQTSLSDLQNGVKSELANIEHSGNNTIKQFSSKLLELSNDSKSQISNITKQCVDDNSKFVLDCIHNFSNELRLIHNEEHEIIKIAANEISKAKNELSDKFTNFSVSITEIGEDYNQRTKNLLEEFAKELNKTIFQECEKIDSEISNVSRYKKEVDLKFSDLTISIDKLRDDFVLKYNDLSEMYLAKMNTAIENLSSQNSMLKNEFSLHQTLLSEIKNEVSKILNSNAEIFKNIQDMSVLQQTCNKNSKISIKLNIAMFAIVLLIFGMQILK